ncbi:gas vesicle protein GVPa [mine drainage metagenome]|uniref:Gas vesicle protein GVPa n=1 Tax=mine drainage metagenome TaxID=410659 RepID=T1B3S7_9ZZZZ
MAIPASRSSATLIDILDRVLDKGLVINADITVSLVGTELLGIRLRAALASFETAARYGLEFPGGTRIDPGVLEEARGGLDTCPQCGKRAARRELLDVGCPWCGWVSARAQSIHTFLP